MPRKFKFKSLIKKYLVPFTYIETTEGYWKDNGDYVNGETNRIPMEGVILPLNEDDLQYAEPGSFSSEDRKIYSVVPLEKGQVILYKGKRYTIQNELPLSDYTDAYIYHARWRER